MDGSASAELADLTMFVILTTISQHFRHRRSRKMIMTSIFWDDWTVYVGPTEEINERELFSITNTPALKVCVRTFL